MNLIEEFKNQHIIFKILDILFIISHADNENVINVKTTLANTFKTLFSMFSNTNLTVIKLTINNPTIPTTLSKSI